jgi:threonine dehydrogenase-like Zn-dependent dehydrogenase
VGPIELREGQLGETLVEVAAAGICGSDLHYFKDGGIGAAVVAKPFVPGHEIGGYLCEDVPECGLSRGALVAVDPNVRIAGAAGRAGARRPAGACDGTRTHLIQVNDASGPRWH